MMNKILKTYSLFAVLFFLLTTINVKADDTKIENKLSFNRYVSRISSRLPDLKANEIAESRACNQVKRAGAVDDTSLTGEVAWSQTKQYSYGGSFAMDYVRGGHLPSA